MSKLNDEKQIECTSLSDKKILIQSGYFNLINGYKIPFSSSKDPAGNHIYEAGTTLENIYAVKKFDDDLRMLLFHQIVRVEEEVRTLAGYKFDSANRTGQIEWFQINAYRTHNNDKLRIAELISSLLYDVNKSKSAYLNHYKECHHAIPTWILIKVIRLSNFIKFLQYSKTQVKADLCHLYAMIDERSHPDYILLIGSLHFMRKIRNACAHNERVFDISDSSRINCSYFSFLPQSYNRTRNAEKRLVDFIIYMGYYLETPTYHQFIDEVYQLLIDLKSNISPTAFDYIRGKMGIKDENHLLALKGINKIKKFHDFC
jgi:abortive infection bacteriophage resistance protein